MAQEILVYDILPRDLVVICSYFHKIESSVDDKQVQAMEISHEVFGIYTILVLLISPRVCNMVPDNPHNPPQAQSPTLSRILDQEKLACKMFRD